MALNLRKVAAHAAAVAAGLFGARTLQSFTQHVDDALALFDEDDEEERCVCGSPDHTPIRFTSISTQGLILGKVADLPVAVTFMYFDNDPHAVTMVLAPTIQMPPPLPAVAKWAYARDLLDSAVSTTDMRIVGSGDVRTQYETLTDTVNIHLNDAADENHVLVVDAESVRDFLEGSFNLVPAGTEAEDVDAAITSLLNGTWDR